MQIKTRLTLQYFLLFAVILGFSLTFFYSKYQEILVRDSIYNLKTQTSGLVDRILSDYDRDSLAMRHQDSSHMPFGVSLEVYDDKFARIYSISHVPMKVGDQELLNLMDNSEWSRVSRNNTITLGYIKRDKRGGQYFVIAGRKLGGGEFLEIRNLLLLTFLISLLVAALGGFWYTRQALRPFKKVMEQVENILPSRLDFRLKEGGENDEISQLVLTFNRMLDRVQEAFDYQKHFTANVAHELKNPISIMSAQLDVLLQQENRSGEDYRQALKSVLRDCYRLSDITDNLLQLSRIFSDSGKMITSPWRIEDLLMESRGLLLRSNPEYKILINYVGEPIHEEQLFIEGNKSLLKSAFMNIMDNCCKYSNDQTVEINLVFEEDGRRIIEMSDRGPGMNAEDIPLIFKPFYRDPKTQHKKGSGIGLTLVDSVMRLHQIDIEVLSERDKGTTFRLKLPPSEVK